ncbi:MAG: DUF3489 domain-containing protein [Acidobacteria bacterium]|nr:DUF3489 domain-containing protein [Acidobacteriota bacterium]
MSHSRRVTTSAGGSREGTKGSLVLDLQRRPSGATLAALAKATEWQPHRVRGFISGAIGKKMGSRSSLHAARMATASTNSRSRPLTSVHTKRRRPSVDGFSRFGPAYKHRMHRIGLSASTS